jgi:UDP-N-acetylglucosamine 2-epimerase (non-hydrolysing)
VDDSGTLRQIFSAILGIQQDVPVIFPVHPRTRERLERIPEITGSAPQLKLIDPLSYLDFIQLMSKAACVLTDSGGIQEETTALGVPCLTLRTSTERPITVTRGTNRITGVDTERINVAWKQICRGDWPTGQLPDLWDGKAAERIVQVLLNHDAYRSHANGEPP